MATPSGRSRPDSQSGVLLPGDTLYEILLRLPARDLCRLRAVCRPWRRLLSDPHFIAAHAGRHPEPLVVGGCDTFPRNDGIICDVMDLSGRVVKSVRGTDDEWVTSIHLNFVCISTGRRFRLLNLATGAIFALPEELTEEHAAHERDTCRFHAEAAFGQVPSTGVYKVLRVLDRLSNDHEGQLYEVITLNGSSHAQWRGKKPPPYTVRFSLWKIVVVNGIVYFFSSEVQAQDAELDRIASFDLETEEWRASLRGPLSSLEEAPNWPHRHYGMDELTMSDMNGCLVVVHRSCASNLDLWFLMDFERGIWIKQHSIQVQLSVRDVFHVVRPLLVLNDGRIVLFYMGDDKGSLRIYNPRTNISTDATEVERSFTVGLYTGSPLSLANGAS
ncbi:unnamed protein product [Urochloa decumbens]|uniref:F-box domain-containing protein n=1 Tax=Urochloa decumbens TaxID=240449 RepID=A0ABC8VDJ6_9POAL